MTINSTRMERLRRARSLNDILTIGNEVSRDITLATNISKVLGITPAGGPAGGVSTAATLKFSHDKMAGTKVLPTKISVKTKPVAPSKMGSELVSFKAPPVKQVLQHSSVIHALQENLYELEAAQAMIRTTFSRAKNQGPALKSLTALVKEARTTLTNAYDSLAFIAQKHLPDEMALLGEDLRAFLIEHLNKSNYSNLSTRVYVTAGEDTSPVKKPSTAAKPGLATLTKSKIRKEVGTPTKEELKRDIVFAFYIDIEDLKDTSGAVLAHYYVILTGVIGLSGKIRYFLTALPDFQPPGLYSPGGEVETSEGMLQRLSLLLSTNDITSTLERKPMPINTADAARKGFNLIDNVETCYVADEALWVVVKTSYKGPAQQKVVDKVVEQVFPLLNAAVGNTRRTKSVIKYSTVLRKGKTVIKFFLTPNKPKNDEQSKYSINAEQLLEMKEQLGIPSHVMDDIKKVLKRHI